MANAVTLLSNTTSPYNFNEQRDVTMLLLNQEQPKVHFLRSDVFAASSHSEQLHRSKQYGDSIENSKKRDIDDCGCLNLRREKPSTNDHIYHDRIKGCNSQVRIESEVDVDSLDDGQTMKIPSRDATRPLWNLVNNLRDNWNTNLARVAPDHTRFNSNQTQNLHSHNPKSSKTFLGNHENNTSTMLKCPLPTEFLPARRTDVGIEGTSRPCPSRRIRSRAIAIKPPTSEEQFEEIRQNTMAAEYDWATWRMYNRIIDHRQKYPLNYHHEESALSAGETLSSPPLRNGMIDSTFAKSRLAVNSNYENLSVSPDQIQHYPEYGEVFELDL
jgi:hypothetical protein